MRVAMMILGLVLAVGCAHSSSAEPPPPDSRAQAVKQDTREAFDSAYHAVEHGGHAVANAGSWVMDKTKEGYVRVMYSPGVRKVARVSNDSWITTKLKTEYGFDRDIHGREIHVTTKNGVVTLVGLVHGPGEAQRAIERALDTAGVTAVNSELAWPESYRARTYEKGQPVHE